ncbi:MAG: alpha/beta hydrolase [Alphaproteobacteria bacterium]|nr:alpha/beta hydrolase [Alphaproteobacteria bacterium]
MARHRLDIYRPDGARKGMPVVVFLHGGAYVRGERNLNAEIYGNVSMYFAQNRMLGVNATYRLAPAAQWPAASEDVSALVTWLKAHASEYGGDPRRIYLIGHSAGATHVATYAFLKDLHPKSGPGVAGLILMSGRYHFDPNPDDPNLRNFQAYFGTDPKRYPAMSPINHVKRARKLPVFIAVAEYDNPDLDTQGAMLLSALCQRDRACPRFTPAWNTTIICPWCSSSIRPTAPWAARSWISFAGANSTKPAGARPAGFDFSKRGCA